MKRAFTPRRPSAAMIVAMTALFVALGGTGYAAFSLPQNSVGTKQLKRGAVTSAKIKNGAVTAAKLNVTGVTVPSALHANRADTAGSATNATNATNASHATNATNATNASHATTADIATSADTAAAASSLTTLPSGTSESGTYDIQGGTTTGQYVAVAISYPQPLASPGIPDANVIWVTGAPPPHCPGIGRADPGYLCLYDYKSFGITFFNAHSSGLVTSSPSPGAVVNWSVNTNGGYAEGTWTVTAP
jgi:hypothetical protein